MQCGFGRDLIFGFPGFEDYKIHATPSFSKVTMETTYFQHEKQIFRNYNHDFRKAEIIWHKTNDVLFCYTFGWGNSYFKPLFEEWPQHYKAKRAGSTSTSRRPRGTSPKRDYPRGTCTVTRPSQASPRKAEHTVTPAQDLEAFKADMTSMLSDMLQTSFQKFASQFNTNSGGQRNDSQEDTVPKQVYSEPTVDVASDDDNENFPTGVLRTSPNWKFLMGKPILWSQAYPH